MSDFPSQSRYDSMTYRRCGNSGIQQECERCFTYEVLRPECDIQHFYRHFKIEAG